jgi:prepilin-type N-terminal cleavage/methylation domain-containing protein
MKKTFTLWRKIQAGSRRGFTVIESLVAISILVVAVTGTMTAVQTSISSYTFSKDQVIAFYLAQEAFEQIRNIRDENRLAGDHWLTGLALASSDPCYFGQACAVPIRCAGGIGNCPYLRQNPDTSFFGYDLSWPETRFRREIQLSSVNDHEIAVTVTLNWSKGMIEREFRSRENLLNWQ